MSVETPSRPHTPDAPRRLPAASRALRRFFQVINRFVMLPLFRLGLGRLLGTRLTGRVMVLHTIGHRSGRPRPVPVNYAIVDGDIYCLAAWGRATHWFRNLQAHPEVTVQLPTGTLRGRASEIGDQLERLRLIRAVFKSAGPAGFTAGFNPYTIADAALERKMSWIPVVRIRPTEALRRTPPPLPQRSPSDAAGTLLYSTA